MADVILTATQKTCRKCGTSNFYPAGGCKTCLTRYAVEKKEKISAYQAAYRIANKDRDAKRREDNRETARSYAVQYRRDNPEKMKAKAAAWRSANPERARAFQRAWRKENAAKVLESQRRRHKKNRVQINAKRKARYAIDPDKINSRSKAWRDANPLKAKAVSIAAGKRYRETKQDRIKVSNKAWVQRNPELVRIYVQNRRARRMAHGDRLSTGLAQKLFKLQKGKCACCGKQLGDDYHMDHIVPLFLGGRNSDGNMQLLTALCNMQKGAKPPEEFMRERGFLL